MKNGKFAKRRGVATKTLVLVLAVMMIVGISVGGTLAWLTAKSDTVENTFTVGDINITLTETWNTESDATNDGLDSWSAKLIPGTEYAKDPKVTVLANSEKCYLFVEFNETNTTINNKAILTYTSMLTEANDWTQGTGADGNGVPTNVWFRVVEMSSTDTSFQLLAGTTANKDGAVTVNPQITKGDIEDIGTATPKLTYTAYAVQYENMTSAGEAWSNVSTN